MRDALIVGAVRSAVGRKNGKLGAVRPDDLAAHVLRELVARVGIDPTEVEDVVLGCVDQLGEQGFNIARNAALIAGFPLDVCGTTLDRMCGSGQQAANFAAMGVMSGQYDCVIAGGVESMSRVPMGSNATGPAKAHCLRDSRPSTTSCPRASRPRCSRRSGDSSARSWTNS